MESMSLSPLDLWTRLELMLLTILLHRNRSKVYRESLGVGFCFKWSILHFYPSVTRRRHVSISLLFEKTLIHSAFPLPTHPFIRRVIDLSSQVFIWCKLASLHWFLWACLDLCQLRIWSIFVIFEHQSLHLLFPSVGFFCHASERKTQMS